MAGRTRVKQLLWSDEASFCENATSIGSNTYANNIPVLSLSYTVPRNRIEDGSMLPRIHDSRPGLNGPTELGTLEYETYWPGHMTATTGALTATWLYNLLKDALGGGNAADSGGTVSDASITTTQFDLAAADALAGSIARATGTGEAFRIRTVSSNTLNLHNTLSTAPANSSVIHGTLQAYIANTATVTTKRFLVMNESTSGQYHMMGAWCTGLTFIIEPGRPGRIRHTYAVAYPKRTAVTFPDTTTLADDLTGPWASGRCVFATYDATAAANTTITPSRIELSLNMTMYPVTGHGAAASDLTYTGVLRGPIIPQVRFTLAEWATTYETLFGLDGSGTQYKQILVQNSATDGRTVGFYMPYAFITGAMPNLEDFENHDGVSWTMQGREWSSGTNDQSKSPLMLFFG